MRASPARFLSLLLLGACATASTRPTASPSEDVLLDAPPEAVWTALVEVYQDLDYPVESMDQGSGILRSKEVRRWVDQRTGQQFSCESARVPFQVGGEPPVTEAPRLYVIVTTLLQADARGTRIRNVVNGRRVSANGAVPCTSRGVLETEILTALQARLR